MVSCRVYEVESSKKAEVTMLLEADPYADVSFARVGYKLKDGGVLGEDKAKMYLYIAAPDDFFKFADSKLSGLAKRCETTVEKRIVDKIVAEDDAAVSGFGDIFG